MLPGTDCLSRLLGCLYDAASDPTLWEAFLRELAEATDAQSAALLLHDERQSHHAVTSCWGVDPEASRLYSEYYGQIDPWAKRASEMSEQEWYSWGGSAEQLYPRDQLVKTEYYNDFLVRIDLPNAMFSAVQRSDAGMASLGVYRSARVGTFSPSEIDLLRLLDPHLRRAFRLHFQLSDLKSRTHGLESALNDIPTGVFLLGVAGEIIVANRSASAMLSQKDGLIVDHGKLCAQRADESNNLQRLIGNAIATSAGGGFSPGGAISISRRAGPSLQLLVTPVKNLPLNLPKPVRAVVFASDPSMKLRPAREILVGLFGLTPAECRVAMLLTDGHAPRQIGQLLGVSSNTLKSQLASIYAKTGSSRQSQVVRLISQLPLQATNPTQSTLAGC